MINYLINKYYTTKEYMAADVLNYIEVQASIAEILGVLIVFTSMFNVNYGIPLLIGAMIFLAGWVIENMVVLADNILLKVYYMINPTEGMEIELSGSTEDIKEEINEDTN